MPGAAERIGGTLFNEDKESVFNDEKGFRDGW